MKIENYFTQRTEQLQEIYCVYFTITLQLMDSKSKDNIF
jgi:hypothetical protein